MPVYKGADLIGKALECLQRQTFPNFEAIISVDGNDTETADACRPFLSDPRFRMVVHPGRLDWVGNFNWLLQQDLKEFFCYRQHDDTTAPEFFEALLQTADKEPNAAAIYSDCQHYSGGKGTWIAIAPTIKGEALDRMFQYIERASATPLRGLIRTAAIRQAGPVRSDEFRAPLQVFGWLAKLLHWGHFRRIAKPLYYRLDHAKSFSSEYHRQAMDRKRAAATTMFTGLLEAAMPLCHTPEQRLFFQRAILDRMVVNPDYQVSSNSSHVEEFAVKCLERLKQENNAHLLRTEEIPALLQDQQRRVKKIQSSERSKIRKGMFRVRQRSHLARLIYPQSVMRRVIYRVENFFNTLGRIRSGA